jgi:hypothetical protein
VQDYTDPHGYSLLRQGRLYAVPAEPNSGFGVSQGQAASTGGGPAWAAQYSRAQAYARSLRAAAEKDATAIRQQAADEAASLTREASREAARIREAAQQEAAEVRAALAAVSGEMGRVAAYVTENLAAPATRPTRPSPLRALPRPDTKPAQAPGTRPERLPPLPAKRTRQEKAFRVARFGVAAGLLTVAAVGTTEFAVHGGSPFFLFRQGGTGETPGSSTDQGFLARQEAKSDKPKEKVGKPALKNSQARPAPKASR